jgi:hypothetical protein
LAYTHFNTHFNTHFDTARVQNETTEHTINPPTITISNLHAPTHTLAISASNQHSSASTYPLEKSSDFSAARRQFPNDSRMTTSDTTPSSAGQPSAQTSGQSTVQATAKATAAALALAVLAVLLLGCGAYAFLNAPAEANKTTAAVIPAFSAFVMILLAIWVKKGARTPIARTRIITSGIIAIVFALLFSVPTYGRVKAMRNYPAANADWSMQLSQGKVEDTNEVRRAFFKERGAAWYDQTFLVRTLGTMLGATASLGLWMLVSGVRLKR